jgi:hypothetical protein
MKSTLSTDPNPRTAVRSLVATIARSYRETDERLAPKQRRRTSFVLTGAATRRRPQPQVQERA